MGDIGVNYIGKEWMRVDMSRRELSRVGGNERKWAGGKSTVF